MNLLNCVSFLLFQLSVCYGANILYFAHVPSPSHHIWNRPIMESLVKQGHNVTAVSATVDKNPPENLHYIHLERSFDMAYEVDEGAPTLTDLASAPVIILTIQFYWYMLISCEGNPIFLSKLCRAHFVFGL